jgi:hypothetical protein
VYGRLVGPVDIENVFGDPGVDAVDRIMGMRLEEET